VDDLRTLLAVMPRDQLQGFKSANPMQLSTLQVLLLRQHKLLKLEVPTNNAFYSAVQSPWTIGCLTSLMSITIFVTSLTCGGLRKLWDECPKLTHISFVEGCTSPIGFMGGPVATVIPEDAFTPIPSTSVGDANSLAHHTDKLRLLSLRLGHVTLPQSLDAMFQRIDMLVLRELTLINFVDASRLFEAMAAEFTKGHPGLRTLDVKDRAEQVSEKFVTSLCLLLFSFQGLRSLRLQLINCNKLDVDSIVNHGKTLKALHIVNGGFQRQDASRCLDALDMHKIATACPKLEQLCLNLYEIDEDRNESDVLGPQPGIAFTPNEFENALIAIASMPVLSILRFTNPPNYRKVFHRSGELLRYFKRNLLSGVERQGFQARADGLMQYLGENGSNIKVLAFSPVESLKKVDGPDKHGHVWPHYYYYGVRMKDRKGTDVVVARPLVGWKNEFPDATVLHDDV
jgi:hypothetical protein